MKKKTVKDVELGGKRVLLRVDYNVPMADGVITDDLRLVESLPTIEYILAAGASVLIVSHFGRPKGKWAPEFTLRPLAAALEAKLGRKVLFVEDCIGHKARVVAGNLRPGEVALLENVRYYPGEEANDPNFAKQLAQLADVYVNDAFSVDHRAHASSAGVAAFLPGYAGLSLAKEADRRWRGCSARRSGPFMPSSAGRRWRIKSLCWRICCLSPIRCSSVAAWPILFWSLPELKWKNPGRSR